MITVKVVKKAIGIMSLMKFFPSSEDSQAALMEVLGTMCQTDEEVLWLARRTSDLCREWPGINVLWQIRFSKYAPRNKKERLLDRETGRSECFPEGVPSEKIREALGSGITYLPLPDGVSASVDPEAEKTITELAEARQMSPVKQFRTITDEEARVDAQLRQMCGMGLGE